MNKIIKTLHDRDFLASNNIKNFALNKNTDGTSEIQACGDRELSLSMKQEAPTPLGLG